MMKYNMLIRIIIFYCLALLSNIFRKELFGFKDFIKDLPDWQFLLTVPLQSIGVFAGAVVALSLMRRKKKAQYSLFGTSTSYSILIALVPVVLIIAFGVSSKSGINPHFNGILAAISVLVYCYFEEIGWRGYLRDELQSLKQLQRVLIIGFLWWFWHLSFIGNPDIISNLKFLGVLTAAAFGLGILIEQTKSVLTVAAFHMAVNVLFLNPYFQKAMPDNHRIIIVAISVVVWVVIIIFWEKKKTKAEK